jgi:acyl carrier protein
VLAPGRFVPIGRPLDNTSVYVLDQHLEAQPVGIPGELCVGGVAVARGYLNRPELTAQRFVPDPFDDRPGALLYRTGDLARWLPDGTIDFLGRTDRQIKIRGFRIEPGEIEALLERHPSVRRAAVVDRVDARGETRLVAYVEPLDTVAEPGSLRNFLAGQVPNYMLPSAYVTVAQLPYTPNGKVDRDALPEPAWDLATATEAFLAPSTETERRVAGIWSAVLGVEQVGARDNFFALGGHSLVAMQVMSRLRSELGVTLPLRAIFDAPTVSELAAAVDAAPAPVLVSERVGAADAPALGSGRASTLAPPALVSRRGRGQGR